MINNDIEEERQTIKKKLEQIETLV